VYKMYWIMYWGYFHWIWVQYIGKKAKNKWNKNYWCYTRDFYFDISHPFLIILLMFYQF